MSTWRFMMGIVLSSAALAGCGGQALDVGSNDGGASGAHGVLPLGPSPDASGVAKQVWTGHLVNQQFPDGSNTLTLTLDFAPGGQVTGTLLLGDGALLQPPTDPNVGYPPGNQGVVTYVEGFPYTIFDASWSASVLWFQISEYEVWVQWCSLQTSYFIKGNDAGPQPPAPDSYECLPTGGTADSTGCYLQNQGDGGQSPIDCGKLRLCGGFGQDSVCQCSAASCLGNSSPRRPGAWFHLSLAGTTATGTISEDFDYNVQFIRSR
jgi:hypothetical protein